jgi:hypothetical protein
MSGTLTACLVALKAFAWHDLSRWHGLPECTLAELGQVFSVPADRWRGSGHVGEEHRALTWLSVSGGGFPDSIRVWLDGDKVVMMDSQVRGRPEELKALAAKLGAPAAQLDSYFRNALLEKSEWVYPDRGLTLFVEPETHALLRVAAYPRTTLSEYRKRFRFMGGRTVR